MNIAEPGDPVKDRDFAAYGRHVAEGDVTELIRRLRRHCEVLDRHNAEVQRAYEKALESLAHLRRVWAGAAADDFMSHWARTTEAFEHYMEGSRRIKALLEERLTTLSAADRPFEGGAVDGHEQPGRGAASLGGEFQISDWSGYPDSLPRPPGPFRLLGGDEYRTKRAEATKINRAIRREAGNALDGLDIHEIQPVKFGGSPTDMANKLAIPRDDLHVEVTTWWNRTQRSVEDI